MVMWPRGDKELAGFSGESYKGDLMSKPDSDLRSILLEEVNLVRGFSGRNPMDSLSDETSLRGDLSFDSIALAELTVRIEDRCGVDVFASGVVDRVGEVLRRMEEGP